MDDETVQKDSTSEGEESNTEPTLADTVQEAVDKAVLGMESRMKQSARDTARFETSKKSDEGVSAAVREALTGLTLESGEPIGKYLDAADTKARLEAYERAEQQTKAEQQRATEAAQVYYNFLDTSGIGREDPRLDWAADEKDPKKALDRWYASIAKIKTGTAKPKEEPIPKANDPENFVPTDTAGGGSDGIPRTRAQFNNWIVDLPSEDFKKLEPKIQEMLESGQIK